MACASAVRADGDATVGVSACCGARIYHFVERIRSGRMEKGRPSDELPSGPREIDRDT